MTLWRVHAAGALPQTNLRHEEHLLAARPCFLVEDGRGFLGLAVTCHDIGSRWPGDRGELQLCGERTMHSCGSMLNPEPIIRETALFWPVIDPLMRRAQTLRPDIE